MAGPEQKERIEAGDGQKPIKMTRRAFFWCFLGGGGFLATGFLYGGLDKMAIPPDCITRFGDLTGGSARRRVEDYNEGLEVGIKVDGVSSKESEFLERERIKEEVLEKCSRISNERIRLLSLMVPFAIAAATGLTGAALSILDISASDKEKKRVSTR